MVNETRMMPESPASHQSTEPGSDQGSSDDNNSLVPLNKDTPDLGAMSSSEEATSQTVNETHMIPESSVARPSTELSSSHLNCEGYSTAVTLNKGADLSAINSYEEANSSAAYSSTGPWSSHNISDGNSSAVPLNKDTDLGAMNNSEEVIFDCAYCDIFSKRWNEIKIHIIEKHSDEVVAALSDRVVSHRNSSQSAISEVASSSALNLATNYGAMSNSEEVTNHTLNEINVIESSATHPSAEPLSNNVISDGNMPAESFNKDTDLGAINNSEEVVFDCAYCDTVSKQWKEIEIHIIEKHSDQVLAALSDRDMNHSSPSPYAPSDEESSRVSGASSERLDSSYESTNPDASILTRHPRERYLPFLEIIT